MKVLEKKGWKLARIQGSHHVYTKTSKREKELGDLRKAKKDRENNKRSAYINLDSI